MSKQVTIDSEVLKNLLKETSKRALIADRKDIGERIHDILYSDNLTYTKIFIILDEYIEQLKEGKNNS